MYMICICTNLLLCTPTWFYKYYILCFEYYQSRVSMIVEITSLSTVLTIESRFVLMVQRLDWMSMSVLKCAFSLGLNRFATYEKDILFRSTKTHTVTEILIIRICQLTLSSGNNLLNGQLLTWSSRLCYVCYKKKRKKIVSPVWVKWFGYIRWNLLACLGDLPPIGKSGILHHKFFPKI